MVMNRLDRQVNGILTDMGEAFKSAARAKVAERRRQLNSIKRNRNKVSKDTLREVCRSYIQLEGVMSDVDALNKCCATETEFGMHKELPTEDPEVIRKALEIQRTRSLTLRA